MNKNKEIKEKIMSLIEPFGSSSSQMMWTSLESFRNDGGYILIGWNSFVHLIDNALGIYEKKGN